MTKDELRKEATTTVEWECTPMIDRPMFINGYITGAEPRENRIAELEAQIEKMKCGQNCKYSYLYQEDRKCSFTYCDCINCKDKWEFGKEIKEK